ncbi:MAG TPA: hypothetical protein VIG24_03365 [Acidimicrobiia bacterium]
MASVSALRTALASSMSAIPGLRTSSTVPDNPRPPIAVVMPERIAYDLNARRGADTFYFTVILIVSRADDRSAQNSLDGYLTGATSVKAAIEADRTLGGVANTVRVTEMTNYASLPVGEVLYLSAQFTVEVVA